MKSLLKNVFIWLRILNRCSLLVSNDNWNGSQNWSVDFCALLHLSCFYFQPNPFGDHVEVMISRCFFFHWVTSGVGHGMQKSAISRSYKTFIVDSFRPTIWMFFMARSQNISWIFFLCKEVGRYNFIIRFLLYVRTYIKMCVLTTCTYILIKFKDFCLSPNSTSC